MNSRSTLEGRSSRRIAYLAVALVVVGILWWIKSSGPQLAPIAHATPEPQSIAPRSVSNAATLQGPISALSTLEYKSALSNAKKKVMAVAGAIEVQNSTLVFHGRRENTELAIVSITAPSREQVGEISDAMSAAIEGATPAHREALAKDLQQVYSWVAKYPKAYKVLYLTVPDNTDSRALIEANTNEVGDPAPNEDGSLEINGGSTVLYRAEDGNGGWKDRFGHIFPKQDH